jgi:hypothetical protein
VPRLEWLGLGVNVRDDVSAPDSTGIAKCQGFA